MIFLVPSPSQEKETESKGLIPLITALFVLPNPLLCIIPFLTVKLKKNLRNTAERNRCKEILACPVRN